MFQSALCNALDKQPGVADLKKHPYGSHVIGQNEQAISQVYLTQRTSQLNSDGFGLRISYHCSMF
jgi:hypothetical protein